MPVIDASIARIEELLRQGMTDAAQAACQGLVGLSPQEPCAWALLGRIALMRQSFQEAEAALRQAVRLDKRDPFSLTNLCFALRGLGKAAEAEQCAKRAVMLDGSNWIHWTGLGGALLDQRRLEDAAEALRQAIARNPNHAESWGNLGMAEHLLGRFSEAQAAYERALALAPQDLGLLAKYANVLVQRGQSKQGLDLLHNILSHAPQMAAAWHALGDAYVSLQDWIQAEAAYRQVLQLVPQFKDARYYLGNVLYQRSLYSEAEHYLRNLVAEDPGYADAWTVLGWIEHARGQANAAIGSLQKAVQLAPDATKHSRLLLMMQYADTVAPDQLLEAHRQWNDAYARPLSPKAPPATRGRTSTEPLRLGFVSADFGRHPIGFLALRALECLDRAQCSVVCYSDRIQEDEYTARFRSSADVFRQTSKLSDEALADQIRQDGIDVLVDLMGHVGNRLLVFARQPAPAQLSWLGYVGTTGLTAMDFLLADQFHVRPGEEPYYSEAILRMPKGYACYGPPESAPAVVPLPALKAGFVTFGCFNNPAKYSPRTLDAWAAILRRIGSSQLLLKYKGLDDRHMQERFRKAFAERGVESHRVHLEGESSHLELLANYNRVDLALDTQPYSGGLTTCEALWMGVPVITCPGSTFAGRHAVSHLSSAGYSQFIAKSLDEYVELAIHWANRLKELAQVRPDMRDRVRHSPLCDAHRFATDLLSVLNGALNAKTPGQA